VRVEEKPGHFIANSSTHALLSQFPPPKRARWPQTSLSGYDVLIPDTQSAASLHQNSRVEGVFFLSLWLLEIDILATADTWSYRARGSSRILFCAVYLSRKSPVGNKPRHARWLSQRRRETRVAHFEGVTFHVHTPRDSQMRKALCYWYCDFPPALRSTQVMIFHLFLILYALQSNKPKWILVPRVSSNARWGWAERASLSHFSIFRAISLGDRAVGLCKWKHEWYPPLASLDTPHFQVLSHHRVSTLPSKEKREIGKEKKNNWGDANFVFIFLPKKSSGEKGKEFILRQAGTKKKRIKSLRLVCYNFPAHKCLFFRKFTPGSLGPKRTSSGDYIEKTSSLGGGEVEQTFHCFTLPPNAPFRPLFLILFFF
jgi:hypothetical protein